MTVVTESRAFNVRVFREGRYLRIAADGPLDLAGLAIVQTALSANMAGAEGVIFDYTDSDVRLQRDDWDAITRSGLRTGPGRFTLPACYVVPPAYHVQAIRHAWALVCAGAVRCVFTDLPSARSWLASVASGTPVSTRPLCPATQPAR